jgi:hypothetical protein
MKPALVFLLAAALVVAEEARADDTSPILGPARMPEAAPTGSGDAHPDLTCHPVSYPFDKTLGLLERNEHFKAAVENHRWRDEDGTIHHSDEIGTREVLSEFIRKMVNSDADPAVALWFELRDGGAAVIRMEGRSLVINQTPRGHLEVSHLLEVMREVFAAQDRKADGPPKFSFTADEPREVTVIRELLARKIDVDFRAVTPKAALDQLCRQVPGLVVVRHAQSRGDLSDAADAKFDFKARQTSVETVLQHLLPQDWRLRPERGYVLVGRDVATDTLPLRAYPLGRLIAAMQAKKGKDGEEGKGSDAGRVLEETEYALRYIVPEDSGDRTDWWSGGGPATCAVLGDVLFVVQTPAGHRRTCDFLNALAEASTTGRPAKAPAQRPESGLPLAVYPIGDMIDADGADYFDIASFSFDPNTMTTILRMSIRPTTENNKVATWFDEGGPAYVQVVGRYLCVVQTDEGHKKVEELLTNLWKEWKYTADEYDRQKSGKKPRAFAPDDEAPDPSQPKRPLDEVVEINLAGAGLREALNAIARKCPALSFDIDQEGLKNAKVDISKIKITFSGRAPVKDVLEKILDPDLGYRQAGGGRIQVTARPPEAVVYVTYPVGEVFCGPYAQNHPAPPGFRPLTDPETGRIDYEELIRMIKAAVDHQADPRVAEWNDKESLPRIQPVGGCLVVGQTRQGHVRIMAFLQDLYKKRFP